MSKNTADILEKTGREVEAEAGIGLIFGKAHYVIIREIIARLEARKWHYPPKLPPPETVVIVTAQPTKENCGPVVGESFTNRQGQWMLPDIGPLERGIRVVAWMYKPSPALDAEAIPETTQGDDSE